MQQVELPARSEDDEMSETNGGGGERSCDVLILGAGLAGLTLARQLLLASDRRILMVDRLPVPSPRQKVGEATVQMSGYYYYKVLEMEEYLLRHQYLKYNLRFYWAPEAEGMGAGAGEEYHAYHQSYIRNISNIPTFQLDRNTFEQELLRRNLQHPSFALIAPFKEVAVDLAEDGGPHRFRLRTADGEVSGRAGWVVDASGRARLLARRRGLTRKSPIRHGSTFFWLDGLIDIEKLSALTPRANRLHRHRAALGHLPAFLATNHFCGEGFWFWVIPLHGRTSFGLVYDSTLVPRAEVATPAKTIDWVCRRFPLFARALRGRPIVDAGGYTDFAHDCAQTLSAARWAMCGEACRFSDPLYSPGGDLISSYNTMIADAILTGDPELLATKVRLYELLARAIYESYVPSFAVSQEVLGDQEVFSLRYTWELTIYFAFLVFPFINDLFTDTGFLPGFLRRFARLGAVNRNLHHFLVGFYRWKKGQPPRAVAAPVLFDFTEIGHLKVAESAFYRVGLTAHEARQELDRQLANVLELGRWIVAHVAAVTTGDARALGAEFVEGIDLEQLTFDPAATAARLAACSAAGPAARWSVAVPPPERFRQPVAAGVAAPAPEPAVAVTPAVELAAAGLPAGREGR
jgi:2-polyprenyl-6-methoxyphenol hydroxylase-like FAD-dependent oxidoreductase